MPVRRCAPEVEKAGTRREHPHAAALGAWVSLDDLIALVAEAYGTDPQALLRRHSRTTRGARSSSTSHARGVGVPTPSRTSPSNSGQSPWVGSPTRATSWRRLAGTRALRRRVARLEKGLAGQRGDKYKKQVRPRCRASFGVAQDSSVSCPSRSRSFGYRWSPSGSLGAAKTIRHPASPCQRGSEVATAQRLLSS